MRWRTSVALLTVSAVLLVVDARSAEPKFYPDDPISRDPETQEASGVKPAVISEQYDFVENSFLGAGDRTATRALNINTAGEVPDSSWFTNRIGTDRMTLDELVKGPDTGTGPVDGPWTIVSAKTEGVSPGLTVRDAAGTVYFVKFDPPANPEMASGAEIISTKFFHALGYHVPENYVAFVKRESLQIGSTVSLTDRDGRRRRMEPRDVDDVLAKAARQPDGAYRVIASKALQGTPVGPFRYHGTRPDDPNDIVPHEHRRELRGLSVFAAWLNHDGARSVNSLDTLVSAGGRTIVRHHLIDFGSTLGSGTTQAQTIRSGNEYIWESRPTIITMLTFGFYVRPWIKVQYPEIPAVGRFEAAFFRPEEWKAEYANPAFLNARPEDRFWAAHIVSKFSNEAIATIVGTAKFTDPRATEYLTSVIQSRRTKVMLSWLNVTNPVVNPALDPSGVLTFDNAAEQSVAATRADRYTIQWSAFDNATGTDTPSGEEQTVTQRRATMPASLGTARPEFVTAKIRAFHAAHPAWADPLALYFRRSAGGWLLAGVDRGPDPIAPQRGSKSR